MRQGNINDDATLAYLLNKNRDTVHPVGSIFITVSNADPAKDIGGKWKKRSDFTLPNGVNAWERVL